MTFEAYVLSDLHLGAGDVEPDLEDFHQDAELADLVGRIARPGVTLFLNGDFIDFPQIPPYDVGPADHLLWDEAASVQKVTSAITAHKVSFDALRGFVDKGGTLRLHAGNHDLDLAWPGVQARLRSAIGAAVQFEMKSSVYHGVHIEHGHMFTPENAPRDAANFIHSHKDASGVETTYLERVWGTDFMLQFYNDLERAHRFADNVKPMLTALRYGITNRWVGSRDVLRLIVFLKRSGVPWAAIGSKVLSGPPDAGDVLASLEDADWQRVLAERLSTDPDFQRDIESEMAKLPSEQRALLSDGRRVALEVPDPADAGDKTMGIFRDERQIRAAKERLAAPGVTHVVFGHTHELIRGELGGCLFNTGTWLPHMDFNRGDVKAKIKASGLTLAMLDDAALYDRERWVARIVPDPPGRSHVELVPADAVK